MVTERSRSAVGYWVSLFSIEFLGTLSQMTLDAFEVIGGQPLSGEIVPQGAKNEALQVLCAPLLTAEKVTIANVPQIQDVVLLIELLEGLGVKVEKTSADTYTFQAGIQFSAVDHSKALKLIENLSSNKSY